jgi:hypothetical protein
MEETIITGRPPLSGYGQGEPTNVKIIGSITATPASNGATGSAVPSQADYAGVNVAGTLRGATGVNPSGSKYAQEVDLASVAGTTTDTNSGNKSAGSQRVVIATDDVNMSAIAASASVLDDWDESDRAKVNPIAGQAGVQGGSGTVSALTQRVVLATDVALPTGTNAVGRVGHDITGIAHGVTTVTTAGTDVALAASTACKRVVIQSQTDNTGYIAVGASGVDATIATGTGVLLSPGDAFELEIDNLADVFIDSTVNGEGVRYTYFT